MMQKNVTTLIILTMCYCLLLAQPLPPQQISLWPNGAPGFENRKNEPELEKNGIITNVHNPSIRTYFPEKGKANGTAVVICPGGGFTKLVYNSEGRDPALFLNSLGITVFVLKYRLFREEKSPYTYEKDIKMDAYRAMRLVRSRATEWGIDTAKLGIMGFSAGGEVVSRVAYDQGMGNQNSLDPIDRLNGKPNFQILIYPGPLGTPDVVPSDAPPAFLLAANNDECCSEPLLKIVNAYRKAKASVELHLYSVEKHGFNMGYRTSYTSIKAWPQRLAEWLEDNKLLTH